MCWEYTETLFHWQCFSNLTPFLLRDVLQRGISQYSNYCVIAELPVLCDVLTRTTERPFIAATSSERSGSSSCAVERPGREREREREKSPVTWSPITQLNMLIEKRYWKFLAAKRWGSFTDHSKLWTKGEQIKATNLNNFVWKLCVVVSFLSYFINSISLCYGLKTAFSIRSRI